MTLDALLALYAQRPKHSVPDWMLGFWKRYAISFATGLTDIQTHVCWLQSRNFTIDLRLPIETQQAPAKPIAEYNTSELNTLANNEGWVANSVWDGEALSWQPTNVTLQLHNRWPEPAILKRVGNCMIEFCDSDAYVEDWRLQPSAPGPLIGLQLIVERECVTGKVRHQGGGLIVCGDYAALVLGRPVALESDEQLKIQTAALVKKIKAIEADGGSAAELAAAQQQLHALFDFETSVAKGSLETGYSISLSTQPGRVGQALFDLEGFEYLPEQGRVRQVFIEQGVEIERLFVIDTLEAQVDFHQSTPTTLQANAWLAQEAPTLTRYTKTLA